MAAVTNFIITPLSFLSGTFYSIERLPEVFHGIALANPFFHMIDGVRYGFTDHSDGNVLLGAAFLALRQHRALAVRATPRPHRLQAQGLSRTADELPGPGAAAR